MGNRWRAWASIAALLGAGACSDPPTQISSYSGDDGDDLASTTDEVATGTTRGPEDPTAAGTSGATGTSAADTTTFGMPPGSTTDVTGGGTTDGDGNGDDTTDDDGTTDGGTTTDDGPAMMETEVLTVGPGLNLDVVDNAYDGSLGSMTCAQLDDRVDPINQISAVQVRVGLSHTWSSDIVVKLVSPAGTVITLVSQPGAVEAADNGNYVDGPNSNLSAMPAGRITFYDGAPNDAESIGVGLNDNQFVCIDNGLCEYSPNPGAAAPGNLSSLAGEASNGQWRLCMGDVYPGDLGSIDFVELTIDQVP